ncbi:hypothetical protein LSCM1_04114 [Leishmania martiniquensis]|uniref:Uncharacterized protein n=1 Tax=Leishmania martiniquensis TaxID=1580590 RepID=A0A836HEP8_9TRYP|nr:hypothetical protein LSCM1_04114 [Leishmania martiniquensis]
MPLLPWRCLCLRGSLAHSAIIALARPLSSSPLPRAQPWPPKRRRRQERGPVASGSRKKRASAPQLSETQGIVQSQGHADSPLLSSSSQPPPSRVTTEGEVRGAVAPASILSSVEEKERELLRYFGRGRHLYDMVQLQSTSFALQRASCTQAQRVPLATLFPAPPRLEGQPSTSVSAAACLTEEPPGGIRVQPSAPCPLSTALATEETPAPTAPSAMPPPLAHVEPSHLFSGDGLQERQHSDWLRFRLLSARFSSATDSNKLFGAAEVPLRDVCTDVTDLWGTACMAWEEAMRTCRGALSSSGPYSVCFLVSYAQTQQRAAVGASMQRIVGQVCELARANSTPQLFRVIPIFIGMRPQALLETRSAACNAPVVEAGAKFDGRSTDNVTYAKGGLYTLAETVQCIARLGPHAFHPRTSADALSPEEPSRATPGLCTLEPQTFLLSDSWLHVRSVADLHSGKGAAGYAASDSRGGFTAAPPTSEEVWGHRGFEAPFFVPESMRRNVHVVPSVVTDCLSPKEERALARYVWCDMQRRVGNRHAAEAQPPPPPPPSKLL